MRKHSNPVLLGSLLFWLSGTVVAQKSVSVVAGGQMHVMKARFVDKPSGSNQIQLVPHLYRDLLVGVAVELSPCYAVQATAGLTTYGFNFNLQADPQTKNGSTLGLGRGAFEYALVVRRQYRATDKSRHTWFTDLGVDVEDTGAVGMAPFKLRSAASNGGGPGVVASGTFINGHPYRLGARAGVGREWAFSPREYVSVEVLGSLGLRDLQRYQLQSVVWEQGPTIDPVSYDSVVATRFSFVGVQARYRFQW